MTKFSRTKLAAYVADQLKKGVSADDISEHVAAYLISNGKTAEVNSLMRDVMEARAEKDGVIEVVATSAFPLSDAQKQDIERATKQQYPSAREVIIHHNLDKSLVGGINLSLPHSQLDLSIRTKLNRLRAAVA